MRRSVSSVPHIPAHLVIDTAGLVDARHRRGVQLGLRLPVGVGRDAAQVRRLRHRHFHEPVGDDAVGQSAGHGLRAAMIAAAQQHLVGVHPAGVAHDFQCGDRERYPDAHLGRADLRLGADQAAVAGAREHAAARDGGAVDRGDGWPRVAEHRLERRGQRGNQPIGVAGAALHYAVEVDAGAEGAAGTGDNQRAGARTCQVVHRRSQLFEQLDILRVDRTRRQGQHLHGSHGPDVDHGHSSAQRRATARTTGMSVFSSV